MKLYTGIQIVIDTVVKRGLQIIDAPAMKVQ
ncbi:hypothetical protein HMPREF9432_01636 [Selenomonas noxia F0398]|uniref:Uncharacterized protein n=1 Tax=Selenomonas noxia F0398 TaxID=702437 RepID=A0ABP2MNW2_9FIRM|nr:hypothetical protein HMPREF9432_01636 [Selenomonas noxia F0398]